MASQSSYQRPNTLLISLFFVFIFIVLPPSAESLSFRFPHFNPNTTNVVYEGDAVPSNGEIVLNRGDYIDRVARATYGEHLRVWDPANGNLTDFTTNFSFIIDTQNKSVYSHGLVFFLASVDSQIPLNSMGGFLGLFNTTTLLSPSNNITGVEFDSFSNPEWEPPGEHVGFMVNSLKATQYVSWNASMHSLDPANAQVSYEASTQKLNLLLTYNSSPLQYSVSLDVDLRKILPEWVKIGFSTATSAATEVNRILSWEFSSTLEGKEIIDANKHGNLKLILGLSIPFGTVVAAAILLWVILKRSKTKEGGDQVQDQGGDPAQDQGGDQGVVRSFDRALEMISGRIRR